MEYPTRIWSISNEGLRWSWLENEINLRTDWEEAIDTIDELKMELDYVKFIAASFLIYCSHKSQ